MIGTPQAFPQDIRYAMRSMRRNIGVTAVIVGALAVGIGASTAIFALINAVLLRQLPVSHPEQLVVIGDPTHVRTVGRGNARTDVLSYPLYRDVERESTALAGVLASGGAGRLDVRIDAASGDFEHPTGRYVSANYFSVLGVPAFAGRTLEPGTDDAAGTSPVVTISYGYWTRRFNRDRMAVGRSILVDGVRMTIVGVTPPGFGGEIVGEATDIWIPATMHDVLKPHDRILADRSVAWLLLLARLKPAVALPQAAEQVKAVIVHSVAANSPAADARAFAAAEQTYYFSSGARGFSAVQSFKAPLLTLLGGVLLLLLIICANVANLLLARAIARGREMAVRLALGASRARLARQLIVESAVLAGLSVIVGLVVAWWGSRALLALASDGRTIPLPLSFDPAVVGFAVTTSVLAVGLFGLVPALHASQVDLASTMRANAPSLAGSALTGRGRARGVLLIAGQVALSIVLLVGATMLARSLRNLQDQDVGFDHNHLIVVDVDISVPGYREQTLANVTRTIRDRLAALPGVAAVSYSENGFFAGRDSWLAIEVPGFVAKTAADTVVSVDEVGDGYARTIGMRLLAGRDMRTSDEDRLPRVALVNEAFAQFYFGTHPAVGAAFHFNDTTVIQIIGVVASDIDHDLTRARPRRVYFPYLHTNDSINLNVGPNTLRFLVRTAGDPAASVPSVRASVVAADPYLPIDAVTPVTALMRSTIRDQRLVARLATALGTLALLLAALGLYGVMSYAVARRTSEIGMRMALGAGRGDVVSMVMTEALRLVAAGAVAGLPLALLSARLLRSQLHGVAMADPLSIATAVAILTFSALMAAVLPALRASRVSPIVALRT